MGKFMLAAPAEKSFLVLRPCATFERSLVIPAAAVVCFLRQVTSTQVGLEFGVLWRMTLNSRVLVLQLWYQIV